MHRTGRTPKGNVLSVSPGLGRPGWPFALTGALLAVVPAPAPAQDSLRGPPPDPGPVLVRVGLHVADFPDLDMDEKTFQLEGTLTLRWQDDRQRFDPSAAGTDEKVYQGDYQFAEVFTGWWPELVLRNESGGYERQANVLRVRPDGSITYVEEFQATAEAKLDLHTVPFDAHDFEIVFSTVGFGADRVRLVPDPERSGRSPDMTLVQWRLGDLAWEERTIRSPEVDPAESGVSAVAFRLPLARRPGHLLKTVVIPLMLLVSLTWSVFWMDRESLGDRMDISFIGILTVVAYQIVIGDELPRIPYLTLIGAFLYVSYVFLAATVVVNLRVGALDKRGDAQRGNRLDRACRWLVPLGYAAVTGLIAAFFLIRY